mgnify:CR=1 FL=1
MVVLITGCRSGFGLLSAQELAERGHTVVAGLRDVTTAEALREATEGRDVHPVALDVTKPGEVASVIDRIERRHGRLDALVNNAGIGLGGFLEQVDDDEMQRLFDINVFGVHRLTRAALPLLRASRGSVVMVSSMSGQLALPALGAYAASKFALEGMSEAWRHELRPFGVRVTLVEPGPYKTDIFTRNRQEARRAREPASPYATYVARIDDELASVDRRAGDARDVARRIADIVEDPAPPLRHPMGPGSLLRRAVKRLAPWSMWERAIARRLMY